jgi:hypothetical protein
LDWWKFIAKASLMARGEFRLKPDGVIVTSDDAQ